MTFEQGHSLLIGVGGDLGCTVDDARALADLLRDPEICGYPNTQVTLLTEEGASRDHILNAMGRLADVAKEATVVIYFSGHGMQLSTGVKHEYYLIPSGYHQSDLASTAIKGTEFTAALDCIPARKVLLLLDCCHAGGIEIAPEKDQPTKVSRVGPATNAAMPPEIKEQFGKGSGRIVVASSRDQEKSLAGTPYSAFTTALLEALRGEGAAKHDGYVRALDLALHTRQRVPLLTNQRQHPVADMKEADNFVISYYAGGEQRPKPIPASLIWNSRGWEYPPPSVRPITYANFQTFTRPFLDALKIELLSTGVRKFLIPESDLTESGHDGWYFYFEAANSPLNARFSDEPAFYFALRIVPGVGRPTMRDATARMYCIIETKCLVTPGQHQKVKVRKRLMEDLNKDIPSRSALPATLDTGGIWLEIGAQSISSFDNQTADTVATVFANNIPVVENRVAEFLDNYKSNPWEDALGAIIEDFRDSGFEIMSFGAIRRRLGKNWSDRFLHQVTDKFPDAVEPVRIKGGKPGMRFLG